MGDTATESLNYEVALTLVVRGSTALEIGAIVTQWLDDIEARDEAYGGLSNVIITPPGTRGGL